MSPTPVCQAGRDDARRDDPRAAELESHFRSSFKVLWLIAVGIVGEASAAEDVVQEAAVIALNKLDQYQPGSNFAAWASQIVRNVAFNRARSERRRRVAGSEVMAEAANLASGPAESAISGWPAFDKSDLTARVVHALAEIGEIPRACLLLRTVEGLPYQEISRLLEIPEGTAMSHVHRTRQALRNRLRTAWIPGVKEVPGPT